VLRTAIVPVASAFVAFVAIAAYAWRHPDPSGGLPAPAVPLANRLRYLARTVLGGYLVLLMIVLVFHSWIAGQRGAFPDALLGGGVLSLLAFGIFATTSWILSRRA
jgi:hypothetical protein